MLKQSVNFKLPVGKAITKMTKQKFYWFNEGQIRWKNND